MIDHDRAETEEGAVRSCERMRSLGYIVNAKNASKTFRLKEHQYFRFVHAALEDPSATSLLNVHTSVRAHGDGHGMTPAKSSPHIGLLRRRTMATLNDAVNANAVAAKEKPATHSPVLGDLSIDSNPQTPIASPQRMNGHAHTRAHVAFSDKLVKGSPSQHAPITSLEPPARLDDSKSHDTHSSSSISKPDSTELKVKSMVSQTESASDDNTDGDVQDSFMDVHDVDIADSSEDEQPVVSRTPTKSRATALAEAAAAEASAAASAAAAVHDDSAATHHLHPMQVSRRPSLRRTRSATRNNRPLSMAELDLDNLMQRMLGDTGITITDRKYHLRTWKRCFIGKDAVSWMVADGVQGLVNSVDDAVRLGNIMLQAGVFRHVTVRSYVFVVLAVYA
jgi:Domain found in Dishevelled, Egl-10, and Pleckstrin (DEP)